MSKVAVGPGPFVPYPHPVVLKVFHIGIAAQKPEEFMDYAFEMEFLGSDKGESLFEVEAHLVSEDGDGSGSGAVMFFGSFAEDPVKQVEVLAHRG